jgi:hypothetical protein
LRQIRFTLGDFVPGGVPGADPTIPDAVLSEEDLNNLRVLAGLQPNRPNQLSEQPINLTHTAMQRVEYMKEHNIQPGTQEWFRLWFSRPYLTGDTGMDTK